MSGVRLKGGAGDVEDGLHAYATPFNAIKTAAQHVQFTLNPRYGLTKNRYHWFSNDTLFDNTLVSNVEAGISLSTTATATDEVRIRSAYAGQYIAQALAQPGVGLVMDDSNVSIDTDNHASLSHGEVYAGAFWWDEATDQVDTGIGYCWDASGWEFFVKSQGDHIGSSPVSQDGFSVDNFDASGPSGQVVDPSEGYIFNWPYTWYNQGAIRAGVVDTTHDRLLDSHSEVVRGRPSVNTPNLPTQLVVRNAGTASSLTVELGGMQYSTYGASRGDLEYRETDESRITEGSGHIDVSKSLTENAFDPTAEPGVPLISARRESGARDLDVEVARTVVRPIDDDIYLMFWDEYDEGTALTGQNFTDPVSPNNAGTETFLQTDTQATDYTPSNAVLRNYRFIESGKKNQPGNEQETEIDIRVPIDATRVVTAVNDGDTATSDVDPLILRMREGY